MGDGWPSCDFDLTHHCAASARGGGGESSGWQIDPRKWPLADKSTSTVWKISTMWLPIMLRLRRTMETMWHRCSRRRSGSESRVREWREAESRIPGAPTSSVSVFVFSNSFFPQYFQTSSVLHNKCFAKAYWCFFFFQINDLPLYSWFSIATVTWAILALLFCRLSPFFNEEAQIQRGMGGMHFFKQSRKVLFKEPNKLVSDW